MSDFDPPAPTTIRKMPITIGSVVDLQHENSGREGFISGPQVWYRVGGDLNREMVVPTLSNSPIGHEVLGVSERQKTGDKLTSGMDIRIRSVWQSPVWPAYKVWQYLSEWNGDENASYYHIDDGWAKYSIWTIEKLLENDSVSGPGEEIYSGDRVRIKPKNAKDKENKQWLANSLNKHASEHHPQVIKETTAKRITWVIWAQGTAT